MLGITDTKDRLIESQKSEIEFLRAEVAKLTDRLIALTNPVAFQVIKRAEAPKEPEPPPLTQKREKGLDGRSRFPYHPPLTDAEIHAQFREGGA